MLIALWIILIICLLWLALTELRGRRSQGLVASGGGYWPAAKAARRHLTGWRRRAEGSAKEAAQAAT